MLEDLVAAAINDAVRRVETVTQEKMSGLAGGHAAAARLQAAVLTRARPNAMAERPADARARPPASRSAASTRSSRRCAPAGRRAAAAQRMALHLLQHDRDGARTLAARARARRRGRPPLRALQHVHRGHGLRAVPLGASATRRSCASSRRRPTCMMVEQTQAYAGPLLRADGPAVAARRHRPARDPARPAAEARARRHRARGRSSRPISRNEGEATAHYVGELLAARGLKVSRLARGVPVGGELEYVDSGTLAQALRERRPIAAP